MKMMSNRRKCSFGNTSLGHTCYGEIQTLQHRCLLADNEDGSSSSLIEGNTSIEDEMVGKEDICKYVRVAMTDVPPEQVPEGVIHISRTHRPFIRHVRILQSLDDHLYSCNDAKSEDFDDERLHYITLFTMKSHKAAVDFIQDVHGKPFSSLEPDVKCEAYLSSVLGDNQMVISNLFLRIHPSHIQV